MHSWRCVLSLAALGAAMCPRSEAQPTVEPRGDWAARIALAYDRLLSGEVPRFTEQFILADVMLDPGYPRRFSEYSGDLSGRVIGALASMPRGDAQPLLDSLVKKAIAHQRADGRFGNEALAFVPDEIGMEHMALLWGNGRLLVGLLEYNAAKPDSETLASACRLGDFLLTIRDACANDRVQKKVADLAAAGIICFTQLAEPFTMLHAATGDARYLDAARSVLPWLPEERGKQHSHGYLTTLRGAMMLYDTLRDPALLEWVERLYGALVQSDDYEVYGGVRELFAHANDRDEGCSEADFLRLSLHLARVTGNMAYWDRAERCLLNHFFANQFDTGDFGHHAYDTHGVKPITGAGRAWWCCTMHGLRAFRDVQDAIIDIRDGVCRVNLYLDARWKNERTDLLLASCREKTGAFEFSVLVKKAIHEGVLLAFRRPDWMDAVRLAVDERDVAAEERNGYFIVPQPLKKGEKATITFTLPQRFLTRGGQWLSPGMLKETDTEAALFIGPWLVGVDENDNPAFFGEPWAGNHILWRPAGQIKAGRERFGIPCARAVCPYVHEGFPGEQPVTLRPVSERTSHAPDAFAIWLKYRR